jgi:hypothetical protein
MKGQIPNFEELKIMDSAFGELKIFTGDWS